MTDLSRFVYVPGVSEAGDIDLDRQVIHDQSGRRVTESDVEREAAQSERTRPWLKPGGKSLSGGSAHSPRFQVVLSQETADKMVTAAAGAGMSVSKWLRRTVEEKLADTRSA